MTPDPWLHAPTSSCSGLLDPASTERRHARSLHEQAEARLDGLAGADARVRLLETIAGVGPRISLPVH
jgi:hypothetical protein